MDYKLLFENVKLHRLFLIVAIPSIISMVVSGLYQVIDGIFVGRFLGAQAFAAINLVMPLVIINFSVAELIGVGSSVPIAIKLGEKDYKTANTIFTSACILIVLSGFVLGGTFFIFTESILRLMGADETMISLGAQYFKVYALAAPFNLIMFAVDNYLRICGKIKYSMFTNIAVSVMIMIVEFLMLGVFGWGIWAAALASCLGMGIGTLICFIPFLTGKTQLHFVKPQLTRKIVGTIFTNGFPSFFSNVSGRVASILINVYLIRLGGAAAVATYGVLMYVDGIVNQVLYGLCDSLQPAVGYNYGAGNHERVKKIVSMYFGVCALISFVLMGLFVFGREALATLFIRTEDQAIIELTVHAMMLFTASFAFRWLSLAAQCYFTAVSQYTYATVIATATAFAFPILFLLTLVGPLGLNAIWLNMPLSALTAAVLSVVLLLVSGKKQEAARWADCQDA